MKITKYVHSCLLVETPERTALFDPGTFSEDVLDVDAINRLDDIIITHEHADHKSLPLIKLLVAKFPETRITTTRSVAKELEGEGINASTSPAKDMEFFAAPHEGSPPFLTPPEEIGVHYLNFLSHPGDSHSFNETKAILALPVQAPWGSSVNAVNLSLKLKPRYILPIHDWHWQEAARAAMYDRFEQIFSEAGMTFFKLETGVPIQVELP